VSIDAVILDGGIGEEEIAELRGWLRASNGTCPVVFLTSPAARWLSGALPVDPDEDQVVTKPCQASDIREAVEKGLAGTPACVEVLTIGGATLDRESHELQGESGSSQLTPTEFRLMHYLVQERGNIVSTEELLEKVWEFFPGTGSSELVRSHVRNLRGKLRQATGRTDVVQTVPRRGYRLT
jgi:two-component system OmpR family response regulator